MAEQENSGREEPFSKAVRAGKRTYFFDVKATRSNDLYLTITESKRRFTKEGEKPFYEKHKIFLYREDFDKFSDGLSESVRFIRENAPPMPEGGHGSGHEEEHGSEPVKSRFSDVDYDDLGDTPASDDPSSGGESTDSGDGDTNS